MYLAALTTVSIGNGPDKTPFRITGANWIFQSKVTVSEGICAFNKANHIKALEVKDTNLIHRVKFGY